MCVLCSQCDSTRICRMHAPHRSRPRTHLSTQRGVHADACALQSLPIIMALFLHSVSSLIGICQQFRTRLHFSDGLGIARYSYTCAFFANLRRHQHSPSQSILALPLVASAGGTSTRPLPPKDTELTKPLMLRLTIKEQWMD
jgi:hypothetical protein